ncbi:Transmembrane protein 41A-B [Taenia crassiceps]|uniref:Transmembrane protein 41A-B n=1 Tax=Taenia crassiceps TaxID=6207 RepID=A0ABR4QU64_9CEST
MSAVLHCLMLGSVFPASPNWLLNALSPAVGISLRISFATILLGLLPYNLITVHAGTLLSQIDPEKSIRENALLLSGAAIIMVITGILVLRVRRHVIPELKEKPH